MEQRNILFKLGLASEGPNDKKRELLILVVANKAIDIVYQFYICHFRNAVEAFAFIILITNYNSNWKTIDNILF